VSLANVWKKCFLQSYLPIILCRINQKPASFNSHIPYLLAITNHIEKPHKTQCNPLPNKTHWVGLFEKKKIFLTLLKTEVHYSRIIICFSVLNNGITNMTNYNIIRCYIWVIIDQTDKSAADKGNEICCCFQPRITGLNLAYRYIMYNI